MDIYLADEKAYYYIPQVSLEVAHDRLEQKKAGLVAGTVGALLSRPKAEEIQVVSTESRLEAFWLVSAFARTVYDRSRTYIVPVTGQEVKQVTVLEQQIPVTAGAKTSASFSLEATEHCMEEGHLSYTFDSISGQKADFTRYLDYAKTEISDLDQFAPENTLVVPPQARASAVVRPLLAELIKPVQAQVIHEERLNIEAIDLNFRPIYAFEYNWAAKNKRVIVEFDALTGDVRSGGKKFGDQIKKMVTRDFVFDVTADAAGLLIPGGSIAMKLVKAVVDRNK
jgi:hypothetical protein